MPFHAPHALPTSAGGEWTWTCGDDTKGDVSAVLGTRWFLGSPCLLCTSLTQLVWLPFMQNYVACPVDRHCEMGQVIEISCNY